MFALSIVEARKLEHQYPNGDPSTNHPKSMFQLSGVHYICSASPGCRLNPSSRFGLRAGCVCRAAWALGLPYYDYNISWAPKPYPSSRLQLKAFGFRNFGACKAGKARPLNSHGKARVNVSCSNSKGHIQARVLEFSSAILHSEASSWARDL